MQNYVESIEKNSPQSTLLVYFKRCLLGLTESPSLSIGLYKGQYNVSCRFAIEDPDEGARKTTPEQPQLLLQLNR
jgi:hypothetical protein